MSFIFIFVFIIIPIFIGHYINTKNENWVEFWSNYSGAIIGAIVSGFIALYSTRQQIKANRIDSFNNAINFNNYKELNYILNDTFKEINIILKLQSSVILLINDVPGINREYTIAKKLIFYNKTFPSIINFYNSYIMKLKSITGSSLNISKPIKDLNMFQQVIKNKTGKGNDSIYNDINTISKLNRQIRKIHSANDTNNTYAILYNEKYDQYNPSNFVKKENTYLNYLKDKIHKLLEILTKLTNDIQKIRDKNVDAIRKH